MFLKGKYFFLGQPITNHREASTAEMHLLPDPLFRVPLDGAVISDICSTNDGRLFLAARDGCLYELEYHVRTIIILNFNFLLNSVCFRIVVGSVVNAKR